MATAGLLLLAFSAVMISAHLNRAAVIEAVRQSSEFTASLQLATQPLTIDEMSGISREQQIRSLEKLLEPISSEMSGYLPKSMKLPEQSRTSEIAAVLDARYWFARSLFTLGLNAETNSSKEELLE